MDYLQIKGGNKLSGTVKISGSKNSTLPLISATILSDKDVCLDNVPNVVDIQTLLKLLKNLGSKVEHNENENRVIINTSSINSTKAVYNIVSQMRASILVLGPLLARFKECRVSLPGGCAIGARPIDLHLNALKLMGAKIEIKNGYVKAKAKDGLRGVKIVFDRITVGGTENIIMAGALAKGVTTIINSAREPEIIQLCQFLINAGVKIEGVGRSKLVIHGTDGKLLNFNPIQVIPDRIETGTYLCIGAITNSQITIQETNFKHIQAIIDKLELMGFKLKIHKDEITIFPTKKMKSINIITSEFPAFPTDMQAQFMALSTIANGESIIEERLFENRFMHVGELKRLGANITLKDRVAIINSVKSLYGADIMATDLRASSALILAGLVAKGTTNIHRIYHLDRGYDNLEKKLFNLGVDIKRISP